MSTDPSDSDDPDFLPTSLVTAPASFTATVAVPATPTEPSTSTSVTPTDTATATSTDSPLSGSENGGSHGRHLDV
ncbi:hypothetical protein EWM64_g10537 [Hericium alpestre]|uniref:Uncharacterized protein n=1 Tax=Hericium alpestre TaxID=135208 RepID=A0A4Y9ZFF7_9AGAM|nr:hypothetical protein EWM64_g10537 [Hericium alpestre]